MVLRILTGLFLRCWRLPAVVCTLAWAVFGAAPMLAQRACNCPDGRRFAIGASMFGKNSARILITGFHSEPSLSAGHNDPPHCSDLLVLGQIVQLMQAPDGRPFLKRDNLKRGTISRICDTQITFIEPKKSYDFFADDGSALTLTDDARPQAAASAEPIENKPVEDAEESEDLTGQDLLQLLPERNAISDLRRTPFDEQDLKEGAYIIIRKRSKAAVAESDDGSAPHVSQNRPHEVTIPAGTLGRIEKRAGFQSEALWTAEILPDSAPRPFWSSLLLAAKTLVKQRAIAGKVVLPSSQIVEINHFFDQFGVDWTYFGADTGEAASEQSAGTTRLPEIYSPSPLPLEKNVAEAQRFHVTEEIEKAAVGMRLVLKDRELLAASRGGNSADHRTSDISLRLRPKLSVTGERTTLVLDEAGASGAETTPDLFHRQCFVGFDRLKESQSIRPQTLRITNVDVRIFQPKDAEQVPTDFYAIDLEFTLQPEVGAGRIPLVCRFPLASIDLELVDAATRILSSKFEIRAKGEP